MRSGADASAKTPTSPVAAVSLTEEMFREAIELANRVNRRITDHDLVTAGDAPKAAATGGSDR